MKAEAELSAYRALTAGASQPVDRDFDEAVKKLDGLPARRRGRKKAEEP